MPLSAFYSPVFELPLPASHRFPMAKYRLLHDHVLRQAARWQIELRPADAMTPQQLRLAHEHAYLERVFAGTLSELEMRRIGFPWSPELIERSARSAGATLQAAQAALDEGLGVNLAGGTHHAGYDRGQGFCLFNDVAVTIRTLQDEGIADRFVVIDCDVHQGNGTAEIFANDDRVFTISLHGARNFPFAKVPGDRDVALRDGATDQEYATALAAVLADIDWRQFDLAFYLAGADPFEGDRLGRLRLTKAGLAHRDAMVVERCRDGAVPVAIMMAGGYADSVDDIVDIHLETIRHAATRYVAERG